MEGGVDLEIMANTLRQTIALKLGYGILAKGDLLRVTPLLKYLFISEWRVD